MPNDPNIAASVFARFEQAAEFIEVLDA